jgi:3-methyladenine DNA glycosylase AlkD
LCDHLCGELVCKRPDAAWFVRRWSQSTEVYTKRAAFAVIAQSSARANSLDDERLDEFLGLIFDGANDPRRHVRQAVSWALRAIGKCSVAWHDRALAAASELMQSDNAAQRWVGGDAMRELETLVKVPERRLLLTSKSKMGRKALRSQRGRAVRARARPTLPG